MHINHCIFRLNYVDSQVIILRTKMPLYTFLPTPHTHRPGHSSCSQYSTRLENVFIAFLYPLRLSQTIISSLHSSIIFKFTWFKELEKRGGRWSAYFLTCVKTSSSFVRPKHNGKSLQIIKKGNPSQQLLLQHM